MERKVLVARLSDGTAVGSQAFEISFLLDRGFLPARLLVPSLTEFHPKPPDQHPVPSRPVKTKMMGSHVFSTIPVVTPSLSKA